MSTTQSDEGLSPRAALFWICLVAAAPVYAGTSQSVPDGLKLGPWALAPYFETSWERDDNVLRSDVNSESDEINAFTLGLEANLPFRNSMLELSYEASQVRYNSHTFSLDTDEAIGATLSLNLNNKDVIVLRDRYYKGFSDISRIENSEVVFDGEGFTQNRVEVELSRGVNREKGYAIRVTRVDHSFNETDGEDDTRAFFNYEGYDASIEYLQPLPSYKWLLAYYGFRRFDHFAFDFQTGVDELFREERSETAQVGIRGLLGRDQPIVFRVGWGRFRYEFPDGSSEATETTSVAGHLDWSLRVGGGSELKLSLDRRTLASSYDTYYDNSEVGAAFERGILRESSVSLDVRAGLNAYGDLLRDSAGNPLAVCGQLIREDKNYRASAGVDLRLHERLAYQIGASYQIRDSNCSAFHYVATEITIGVSMGWF